VQLIRPLVQALLLAALITVPAAAGARALKDDEKTALDRYVAAADPSYHYELVKTADAATYQAFTIDLTSQTWLTEKEVDRTVWRHWLTIVKPSEVRSATGLLLIAGGANGREAPTKVDGKLLQIALSTKSVVAELRMVPNQPLTFVGDGKPRTEDSFIAYTWDQFLKTGDAKWPARLPMTKSAVRAMDTITAFCASDKGGKVKVDRFVVAGGSKRGWTTWTTAAVDDRVVAIVPIVIDTLNVAKSAAHHKAAYGFFSSALKDYEDMKLEKWAGTPQHAALMKIEDPYSYRARLTMPKLMLNATGDQFFLPDNSQFYFDDLPGDKYVRYVPNADHSLKNSDAAETLLAFYQDILTGAALPKLSWVMEKDGAIRVKTEAKPAAVKLWQATNPTARDFRLETIGPAWKDADLAGGNDGGYVAKVDAPAKGWTAFFVELSYPRKEGPPLKLTTQVRVVPDVLPFAPKAPQANAQ
jgi:PhoPQ-activated pathogenicity-related protein